MSQPIFAAWDNSGELCFLANGRWRRVGGATCIDDRELI